MNGKELNKLVKEHYGFTIEELDNDVAYWCFRCSELQQENKELNNKIDKAIEYLKDRIQVLEVSYSYDKNDEYLNAKLFGGKKELEMLLNEVLKDSDVDECE